METIPEFLHSGLFQNYILWTIPEISRLRAFKNLNFLCNSIIFISRYIKQKFGTFPHFVCYGPIHFFFIVLDHSRLFIFMKIPEFLCSGLLLLDGLWKVSDGLGKMSDALRKVSDGVVSVLDGIGNVLDGFGKVLDGLGKV